MVASAARSKRRSADKPAIAFGRVVTNTHASAFASNDTQQRKHSFHTNKRAPHQKLAASKNINADVYLQTEAYNEVISASESAKDLLDMSPNVKEDEMLLQPPLPENDPVKQSLYDIDQLTGYPFIYQYHTDHLYQPQASPSLSPSKIMALNQANQSQSKSRLTIEVDDNAVIVQEPQIIAETA